MDLDIKTALGSAYAFDALVMFLFAWKVHLVNSKSPTELTRTYTLFSLYTGIAFVFYAAYSYISFEPLITNWGDMFGGPFLYLAAGYMGNFVWRILRPSSPSHLPFAIFILIAIFHTLLHIFYYLFGINTYNLVVLLL